MELYFLICAYVLAGILGLCVGSFLNVLIWRLPRGENIAKPASHCTSCGYTLKWYDNIPVISYLVLRGKCRNCGERISPRYTVVELFNCLMWLACVWFFYEDFGVGIMIVHCLALSFLTVAFFTDLENTMIPDSMTIGLALCAVTALVLEIFGLGVGIGWEDRLIGCAVGLGLFAAVYFGFLLIKKREGLGFGDVKLMGAVGMLLGWKSTILCILVACLAVLVMIPVRRAVSKKKGTEAAEFPFAPYLTVATAFCLFFGEMICNAYLNLFTGGF